MSQTPTNEDLYLKLGQLEGKIDALMMGRDGLSKRVDQVERDHAARLVSVETHQLNTSNRIAWIFGVAAGVSAAVSTAVSTLKDKLIT